MNPTEKRVLISGGGIAGLALAYWLERGGYEPVVVEHAPRFEPLGHYIALKGAGVSAVKQMGIEPACRAREASFKQVVFKTDSGSVLRIGSKAEFDQNLGGYIFFRRSDLHAALFDLVKDRVEVRYGTELKDVRARGDGVEVDLSSGATESFALLFGADGIHSRTRRLVFGDGYEQLLGGRYIGLTVDCEHGLGCDRIHSYFGRGQMVALMPTSPTRVSAIVYHGDGGLLPAGNDALSTKRFLLDAYRDFADEVRVVFSHLDEHAYIFSDIIARVRMPSIVKGRVALLGDAAHCPTFMSGMGSGLALQDAWWMGRVLSLQPDDPATALLAYQDAMGPIAERYQNSAMAMRPVILARKRWIAGVRNLALRTLPDFAMDYEMRRFYQVEKRAAPEH
jgi:2-polyprenyl-6-methoxyphenol hydroxylase-like FAD-dependent oxidoreductase